MTETSNRLPTCETLPILLVDDDEDILFGARLWLRSSGLDQVITFHDSRELLPYLERGNAAAIVLDLFMPQLPGQKLLPLVVQHHPEIPVIVMTAALEAETAVTCMKEGAFDYLIKPVEESRFVSCVRRAVELRHLRQQVGRLRHYLISDHLEHGEAFAAIITRNRGMYTLFQYVEAISPSSEPVLITGETGVGKELIAESIHTLSGRPGKLVQVNAAGLDDVLFSDTLFGHRKGAFTGADQNRDGLITQAASGTLFLDEIGDLTVPSQIKLLRLLQNRQYLPLGADVPRTSDARIVAASNKPLEQLVQSGRFRPDLYYRLSSHPVQVPPLRDRKEDIPLLVEYFLKEAVSSLNKTIPTIPPELITLLQAHHFPGNVRELRAMIFDAVARNRHPTLSLESFKSIVLKPVLPGTNGSSGAGEELLWQKPKGRLPTLKEVEQQLIHEALRRANQNQGIAASFLGISRQALNQRLKRMTENGSVDYPED
ncbi:MAG: sigma-54-dependent Fis family transcriptional regulator [Magnetococcales bacterium]|nr:sigma-54-dependent Fis family transcriptional regulator [Magnetococcales bacterium]